MEHLIGKSLGEANWDKTELKDRDFIFVIRLDYRVLPYEKKEDNPNNHDFEFFIGRYWEKSFSVVNLEGLPQFELT